MTRTTAAAAALALALALAIGRIHAAPASTPVWIDTDPAIGEPERDVDDGLALVQAFHFRFIFRKQHAIPRCRGTRFVLPVVVITSPQYCR